MIVTHKRMQKRGKKPEKAIEIKKFRQISTRFRQNVRNFAVDSFPVIL